MSCEIVELRNFTHFNTKIEKRQTNFNHVFQWHVENFSLLMPGKKIQSPVFSPMPNQRWQEKVHSYATYFEITIDALPTDTEEAVEIPAHIQITLSDLDGETLYKTDENLVIKSWKYLQSNRILHLGKSDYLWSTLLPLKADTLVISTRIIIFELDVKTDEMNLDLVPVHPTDVLRNIMSDYSKMLEESIDTDVILRAQNKKLKVHKAVLRARSAIFHKMFEHKSLERERNIVDIEDISYSVMKKFIKFLYTGELTENNYETFNSLYYVADKYEVLDLLKLSRNALLMYASSDNILDLLLLGQRHGDEYLMSKAKMFAKSKFKDLVLTDKWATFIKKEPSLANELIVLFS